MFLHQPITKHPRGYVVWAVDGDVQKRAEDAFAHLYKAGLEVKAQLFLGEAVMTKSNGLGEVVAPTEY